MVEDKIAGFVVLSCLVSIFPICFIIKQLKERRKKFLSRKRKVNKIHEFIMQDDSDWIDEFYDHVSEVVTEQIKKVYPNIIIGMGEKDDLEEICDISTTLDRNDILNFINLHVPCCDKTKMKIPGAKFCSQCGTAL